MLIHRDWLVAFPKRRNEAQESIGRLQRVKLTQDVNGLESGSTPVDTVSAVLCELSGLYDISNFPRIAFGFSRANKRYVNQRVTVSDEGAVLLSRGKL